MRKFFLIFAAMLGVIVLTGAGCVEFGGSSKPTGPMGVFRSNDKGDSWVEANAYPTVQGVKSLAAARVFRIFTDPSDPDALYLGTRGQGLFYTFNNGQSWQSVPELSGRFIYSVAVDPHDKCTLFVTDGPHIFKTSDCMRSWQQVYTEERPTERLVALSVDYGTSRTVYGALVGGDILVSEDGGKSWQTRQRFGFQVQSLQSDPFTAKRIYVAGYQNGLFRSDDGGNTWVNLNSGLSGYNDSQIFYRLVLHPATRDIIYWVSKYGIVRSTDAGKTWSDLKLITAPGSVNIYSFAINPQNNRELYYVGTILDEKAQPVRSTFYRSIDGGATWVTKKIPTDMIPVALYVHPTQTNMLFMAFTNGE